MMLYLREGTKKRIALNPFGRAIFVGSEGEAGKIFLLKDGDILESQKAIIAMSAEGGGRIHIRPNNITATSVQSDGIALRNNNNENVILHNSGAGLFGGLNAGGNIALFKNTQSIPRPFAEAPIHLSADNSRLIMRRDDFPTVLLTGVGEYEGGMLGGVLRLGSPAPPIFSGEIQLYKQGVNIESPSERPATRIGPGHISCGGEVVASTFRAFDDIILHNADVAEEFDSMESNNIDAGTVMVLHEEYDQLKISSKEYDKKVAGIISGGEGYRPALIMDKKENPKNKRVPLALVGKTLCKVEAASSPIERGDLLTTSSILGHAMKATDPSRSIGSIIGKALRPLIKGKGLIPVLVSLQ